MSLGLEPNVPSGYLGPSTTMETYPSFILDANSRPILTSKALLWGNNAAWICPDCGELVGNRTGDREFLVTCRCGNEFQIHRGRNKNGEHHQAIALGVQLLPRGTFATQPGRSTFKPQRPSRLKKPELLSERPYPPTDPHPSD